MMDDEIQFNRAPLFGRELDFIREAVASGVISGEGSFGAKCSKEIEKLLEPQSTVLLTPSCTHALEMCAILAEIGSGDEVIMPSYTFVSTATAFVRQGATPVFADILPDTLNIDPNDAASLITDKTKAIVCVHYGGFPCEMDELRKLCDQHGIFLIEDAAHALGGKFKERSLGAVGDLATFSFHETKNITCGEGGALVVNRDDLLGRAHIVRDKGTNRKAFFRGEVDKYTWVDTGSSFVLSDILAAFLYGQLENHDKVIQRRKEICERYYRGLLGVTSGGQIKLPPEEYIRNSTGHLFYILARDYQHREQLRQSLVERGILAVSHYQALHSSPYVSKRWPEQRALDVTESISNTILRLPLYYELEDAEVDRIVRELSELIVK